MESKQILLDKSNNGEVCIQIKENNSSLRDMIYLPQTPNTSLEEKEIKKVKEKQKSVHSKNINNNNIEEEKKNVINKSNNNNDNNNEYQHNAYKETEEEIKEESLQKVVMVSLNEPYNLNNYKINKEKRPYLRVPESLEDWIKNHASKSIEEPIIPSEEPPTNIPILETTVDLSEIITPKRSVSCRGRNNYATTIRAMTPGNGVGTREINPQSQQYKLASYNAKKSPKIISKEDKGGVVSSRSLKVMPKFQFCSHEQCEWIATDRCEKCLCSLCLDHVHRFYYSLPTFTPKDLCHSCYKKLARRYVWTYFLLTIAMIVFLFFGIINGQFKDWINGVSPIFLYIYYAFFGLLAALFSILTHLCLSLISSNVNTILQPF